jgi:DNA-binding MarR family transcriptional regulator
MARADEDDVQTFISQWRRQRPDLDFHALEVTARISRLNGLLQHAWSASVADFDLGSGALQVLLALRRIGAPFELTPTDLCRDAFLSSGGMTQLLDRLEPRGLVERTRHPTDRRGLLVRLTPDGRTLADEALARRLASAQSAVAGLRSEEHTALVALLQTLLSSFGTQVQQTP